MASSGTWRCAIGVSALPVASTLSSLPSRTSQAQPLPKWPLAALFRFSRSAGSASAPVGAGPPFGRSERQ
jgi:hypothetical protein